MPSHFIFSFFFSFFFFLLLLLTSFPNPTVSARLLQQQLTTNGLISSSCQRTKYPQLCNSILSSHPNASGAADLAGLVSISLDIAIAYANETVFHLNDLMKETSSRGPADGFLAGCLGDCVSVYGDAVDDLVQSKTALVERSYDTVNVMVSGAMTDGSTCEDGFYDQPGYDSPLTDRNDYFHKLCSISLAIAGLLGV